MKQKKILWPGKLPMSIISAKLMTLRKRSRSQYIYTKVKVTIFYTKVKVMIYLYKGQVKVTIYLYKYEHMMDSSSMCLQRNYIFTNAYGVLSNDTKVNLPDKCSLHLQQTQNVGQGQGQGHLSLLVISNTCSERFCKKALIKSTRSNIKRLRSTTLFKYVTWHYNLHNSWPFSRLNCISFSEAFMDRMMVERPAFY